MVDVSVLMPVYNAEATIEAAVASISEQTFASLELVIVDDGSTDQSIVRARAAWGRRPSLSVIAPGRVGLVAALQSGVEACSGRFIARMDADDIALGHRFTAQVDHFASDESLDVVSCKVECFSSEGIDGGYGVYEDWLNGLMSHDEIVGDMFVESPLAHPSVMVRRSSLLAVGGYQERGWPEDYDLWLRGRFAGWRFSKVNDVLLRWRDEPHRTSRCDSRYDSGSFIRCKAFYLAQLVIAGRRVVIWAGTKGGKLWFDALQREEIVAVAFVDVDPNKIGSQRRGIPVGTPDDLQPRDDTLVLSAVGNRGAREAIRQHLTGRGFVEGRHFICVA